MSGDPKPQQDHCLRCGECCRKASPTLQREDMGLVLEGRIPASDLFTIRAGEMVRDNINGDLRTTEVEIVKIREREEGEGCVYYQESAKSCGIYPNRPAQCSALKCWDPADFMEVYAGRKAARKDLVQDPALLGLMERHETECNYGLLRSQVEMIRQDGEKAVERIIRILKFDYHLRPLVTQRLGVGPDELDFLLGRPLMDTLIMFGLRVIREPDGAFFLTSMQIN